MDARTGRPILFPYSPTMAEWEAMTPDERRRYYASIPQDPEPGTGFMSEGTSHDLPAREAREALKEYFRRRGRHIFLARNLRVIYPGEAAFDPDLLAVLDVEKPDDVDLPAWVVANEKRGIDLAMEVHVRGDREKDAVRNVKFYASLGIPEYFFLDRPANRLYGWRLADDGAKTYRPIIPQGGRLHSSVFDLDVAFIAGRLRFFQGTAELPCATELIVRLERLTEDLEQRYDDAERTRAELEQRVAEAEAELPRLRGSS